MNNFVERRKGTNWKGRVWTGNGRAAFKNPGAGREKRTGEDGRGKKEAKRTAAPNMGIKRKRGRGEQTSPISRIIDIIENYVVDLYLQLLCSLYLLFRWVVSMFLVYILLYYGLKMIFIFR